MEHKSASVAFEDYQEMLRSAVGRLPTGKKVILLADRGFPDAKSATRQKRIF
jgi:hypothetical protein